MLSRDNAIASEVIPIATPELCTCLKKKNKVNIWEKTSGRSRESSGGLIDSPAAGKKNLRKENAPENDFILDNQSNGAEM